MESDPWQSADKQPFRYIIAPAKVVYMGEQEATAKSANYLFEDLPKLLAKAPVTFHIKAQLAALGDQTRDPTQAWPDERNVVDLGVVTITRVVPDSDAEQKRLLGALTAGISPSDDPLIARDNSHGVSYVRRHVTD